MRNLNSKVLKTKQLRNALLIMGAVTVALYTMGFPLYCVFAQPEISNSAAWMLFGGWMVSASVFMGMLNED